MVTANSQHLETEEKAGPAAATADVMAAAHLMETALWATAFRASSEIYSFEKAFYFSA
ncbi:MAG: hypothetical protein ABSG53_32215 [Thermoguttaceae bacterium]|jgi:hypothetical protein